MSLCCHRLLSSGVLSVMLLGRPAFAGPPATSAATTAVVADTGKPVFVQNVAPEAVDAVKAVDAFSSALKAARLDQASTWLDPKVLVLESGSSERSRDEYLDHHAIEDAAFLQSAKVLPRYRQAQATGDLAWVGTESLIETQRDGKPLLLLSTETMVLKKTDAGWRIVHIHWSSRRAPSPEPTAAAH